MASVPQRIDGPVAVIGDVHGQTDKLRQIIGMLSRVPDIRNRWIVFIGDLVDRGPDPAGTIRLYCDLAEQHQKVTWLCGNHEFAMAGSLGLFESPDYIDHAGRWLSHYDAHTTFQSYGVEHGNIEELKRVMPAEHLRLIGDLPWSIEHHDYLFVHAGLSRNMGFDTQVRILRERDYSLSHPPWLYSKDFIFQGAPVDSPVTIVVGHVPVETVMFANGMIATDTSGGVGGELSCVLLPDNVVLQSGDQPPRPIAYPVAERRSWWKFW